MATPVEHQYEALLALAPLVGAVVDAADNYLRLLGDDRGKSARLVRRSHVGRFEPAVTKLSDEWRLRRAGVFDPAVCAAFDAASLPALVSRLDKLPEAELDTWDQTVAELATQARVLSDSIAAALATARNAFAGGTSAGSWTPHHEEGHRMSASQRQKGPGVKPGNAGRKSASPSERAEPKPREAGATRPAAPGGSALVKSASGPVRGVDVAILHGRLSAVTDVIFEKVAFLAGFDRSLVRPPTAPLAERVVDLSHLASKDARLGRRLNTLLDQHAPWTREGVLHAIDNSDLDELLGSAGGDQSDERDDGEER